MSRRARGSHRRARVAGGLRANPAADGRHSRRARLAPIRCRPRRRCRRSRRRRRACSRRRHDAARFAAEAARHTTALVGIGHVGTRYATDVVLQFQAELAVAHAAVGARAARGLGRAERLRRRCSSRVTRSPRVPAAARSRPPARRRTRSRACASGCDTRRRRPARSSPTGCPRWRAWARARRCTTRSRGRARRAGCRSARRSCARFARVWLEDEIGQEVGAKVATILLGERPGLGTGDGLSAYVVYEPQIGKTDGDRNMISQHPRARHAARGGRATRLAALAARDDRAAHAAA